MNKNKAKPQSNTIFCDDNLKVMKSWPDNCIDSIITDPPYGLEFMGKEWDKLGATVEPTRTSAGGVLAYSATRIRYGKSVKSMQQWHYKWAKECLRIAKPGAFMLVFGGTRTFHRLTCAIEDAGWQIRDCLMWLYGSGFPKSLDISKAIDKAKGGKRKVVGKKGGRYKSDFKNNKGSFVNLRDVETFDRIELGEITIPATSLAKQWDGYGTALKPAWEPIIVAMKPVDGNFAKNAEKYGVAGLNIDGGRIGIEERFNQGAGNKPGGNSLHMSKDGMPEFDGQECQGRWPANVILDENAAKILDRQEDVSRFFYIAKASRSERNAGCGGMEKNDERKTPMAGRGQGGLKCKNCGKWKVSGSPCQCSEPVFERQEFKRQLNQNTHPTVKPLQLMRYLCMLLKMPNKEQIILDPFMGSGTTCIACKELGIGYIGIEKELQYYKIAKRRLKHVKPNLFENLSKRKSKKKRLSENLGLLDKVFIEKDLK